MTSRMKGKWAQGIRPRNFAWVIKDALAICERPGGYGDNHRRVRRQEEIIWLREQGFGRVISLIPSPHNLHNYDELGLAYLHRPFGSSDDNAEFLNRFYPELRGLLNNNVKVILHTEEVGDRLAGVLGGYLRWTGMVTDIPQAVSITEKITNRQLETLGRSLVQLAGELRVQRT
ncbi:MAG: hypothetical protein AB7V43_00725 [Acidimicrobiia bacterium]